MASGKLWYVKRGDTVVGPFPVAVVERNIVLGRVKPDDRLSQDRDTWLSAAQIPEFDYLGEVEHSAKSFSGADERRVERRLAPPGAASVAATQARAGERRRDESADIVRRRALSNRVWQSLARSQPEQRVVWVALAAFVLVIIGFSILTTPPEATSRDCSAEPYPGVNWEFCTRVAADLRRVDLSGANVRNANLGSSDLAGANLAGADFAYADLHQVNFELADLASARLTGANLREANFGHANLRSADLRYADLRSAKLDGADLSGALMGNAIGPAGEKCAPISVSVCIAD
jgi:uncharacterized protein YjbI with pentapeptide repeats